MNKTVWMLETDEDFYVSDSLDKLYVKAQELIQEWSTNETKKIITATELDNVNKIWDYARKELEDTYRDPLIYGFVVEELLYCYEVEWV